MHLLDLLVVNSCFEFCQQIIIPLVLYYVGIDCVAFNPLLPHNTTLVFAFKCFQIPFKVLESDGRWLRT